MKVSIKERDYDFVADYPHQWNQSPGGHFKAPMLIGKHKCFVKRLHDKGPEGTPGWNLLVRLKYKNENNLPRLYDLVTTEEKQAEVHYVFYEYLKGTSLDVRLESDILIDLEKLTNDLLSALKSLNKYEHWCADLTEKNIFCEDSGRFLLVNLDNSLPSSAKASEGNDNIYRTLVSRFYSELLGKDDELHKLSGIALNYLQVIFLILRIRIFQQEQQMDYAAGDFIDRLPQYLDNIDPAFRSIFADFAVNPEVDAFSFNVNEVRDLIVRLIVNASITIPEEEEAVPEIISFQASTETVTQRETFTLDWQVQNASHVEVCKNGVPFRKFTADHTSIAINEFYDGRDKEMVYTLIATNDTGIAESLPVTVRFSELPQGDTKPKIISFSSNAGQVKDGEIFTLQWEVEHASYVELYKNRRLFQKFGLDVNNLALSESAQGKKRDIEYTIDAVNEQGQKATESIRIKIEPGEIKVVKPIGWMPNTTILKYLGGVLAAILLLVFVGFRFFGSEPKITKFLPETIAEQHTMIIRGKNFPTSSNGFQVLFNNVKGEIQYNTDDLIRVGVPYLGDNLKDGNVRVAVVIKNDTTYASQNLKVNRVQAKSPFNREQKNETLVTDTPVAAEVRLKPKPAQKKPKKQDTVIAFVPEPVEEKEEPKPVIDIRPLVKLTSNEFRRKTLGGIKDLELTVRNDSPYDLDQVQVELSYVKKNEKEIKKETVMFTNIRAHMSKTMPMPESNRGAKVNYRIVNISSRQFEQ